MDVYEAEQIILKHTKNFGSELIPFEQTIGRVLAENIIADRDLPPYNRATMDGIAISFAAFEQGLRSYAIKATMAAGDIPVNIGQANECIELMTGAAVPDSVDTVIRYEDISLQDGMATINIEAIRKGQNIHPKGRDKLQGDVVVKAACRIDATVISMAASVGQTMLSVKRLPRVMIVSTGDELLAPNETPTPYQIRRSNSYTIKAVLQQHCIEADMMHLSDDLTATKEQLSKCLGTYDVILLSGGVSMGRFDYVPQAMKELQVSKLFHKVQQRPGKPFWFGIHEQSDTRIFAFPGNPVSGFMCLYRYLLPWLNKCLGLTAPPLYAVLDSDVIFTAPLQYFVQVILHISEQGQLIARPVEGNGSGDFANLLSSNAFMELPMEQTNFTAGEIYRIWPFKLII